MSSECSFAQKWWLSFWVKVFTQWLFKDGNGWGQAHSCFIRTNVALILKIIPTLQGTKTAKPAKPAASDLPVPAEGVRNMKSMWEKGNVFSSPTASGTPNKVSIGFLSFHFGGWIFFFLRIILVNYKSSEESVILSLQQRQKQAQRGCAHDAWTVYYVWPLDSK